LKVSNHGIQTLKERKMPLMSTSTQLSLPLTQTALQIARPEVMLYVAKPLMRFKLLTPSSWPAQWADGGRYRVGIRLFGMIPLGWQEIRTHIVRAEEGLYEFEDRGFGSLTKRWHHRITLKADGPNSTHYTDEVDVQAGWFTPFTCAFAWIFYRWRQRRLHHLFAEQLSGSR
jgi:hypothetical protein